MVDEVRFGDVVFRDGKGFSERAPDTSEVIGSIFKPKRKRRSSRGGGGSSGPSASQIAQQKEVARQAAAIKSAREKADRQREEIRQQRAQSGSITGQFDTGTDIRGERLTPTSNIDQLRSEAGVFTITEAERIRSGAPSQRFAVVPTGTTPSQAIGLGAALGGVRLTPDLPGQIQGEAAFKRDRKAILQATTELTDTQIKTQIEKDVRDRPVSSQIFSRAQDTALGGTQLAIGAVEFGVNLFSKLGTQLISVDEQGKRIKSKEFEFGGILGDIREQPTGFGGILGKTLVALPILAEAGIAFGASRAAVGTSAAVGELVTSLAPFKIPTTTFGALTAGAGGAAKGLKFDVKSFKTTEGGRTGRVITGKARDVDDVFLISKQISKDGLSFSQTDIAAPTTTFRAGKFTEGFQIVRSESLSVGIGEGGVSRGGKDLLFGQTLEGLTGSGAGVVSRTRSNIFFDETGRLVGEVNIGALAFGSPKTTGAVSKKADGFDIFAAGRGRQILQIGKEGGKAKVRVDEFNIRGVEFDISKLGARGQFGIGGGVGGRGSRGVDKGLEQSIKQISASISDIAPSVSSRNGASAIRQVSVPRGIFGDPSQFAGTGQFELSSGGQSLQRPQTTQDFLKVRDVPIVDLGVDIISSLDVAQKPRVRTGGRGRSRPDVAQPPRLDFRPDVGTDVINDVIQQPKQKPRLVSRPTQQPRLGADPFFDVFGAGVPPIGGFALPPIAFPVFPSGTRRQRGKKRVRERIAPSLTGVAAFEFGGITGEELKLSGDIGRSPADFRFVPESLVGRRAEGFGLGGVLQTPRTRRKSKKTIRRKK